MEKLCPVCAPETMNGITPPKPDRGRFDARCRHRVGAVIAKPRRGGGSWWSAGPDRARGNASRGRKRSPHLRLFGPAIRVRLLSLRSHRGRSDTCFGANRGGGRLRRVAECASNPTIAGRQHRGPCGRIGTGPGKINVRSVFAGEAVGDLGAADRISPASARNDDVRFFDRQSSRRTRAENSWDAKVLRRCPD
jgi:hypothetical protein